MKKFVAVFVFLVSLLTVFTAFAQPDPCDDRLYYVDEFVAWCVPEGWTAWSRSYNAPHELDQILEETYDNIYVSDLGEFGEQLRIGVQVHEAVVDEYIMAAQVFVADYLKGYDTPAKLIEDSFVEYRGDRYFPTLIEDVDTPMGIVYLEMEDEDVSRLWVIYPFEELNRTYTVTFFLSKDAWDSTDPEDDINLIAYSLFKAEPLVPVATEEVQ